jgi:DNA-binding NarL/FixJ family response regulator
MVERKTILIVDDHPLFREGLVSHLSKQTSYQVIGEATKGEESIAMAGKLHPDLILMDISLPDMNGIDAVRRIRASLPETKVIILSMHSKIDFITDAFMAGASGYVTKDSSKEKLLECLETVMKGEYYMDMAVSHLVIKNLLTNQTDRRKITDPAYDTLTQREQEVMRFIAEGLSIKQTAGKLFISQKTVENHRANIFRKLNIHSTMELIRYAARYGLVDVDLWKT